MSGGSIRIHPAALEEAEAAIGWYTRLAIERINHHPKQWLVCELGTRRIVLRTRFHNAIGALVALEEFVLFEVVAELVDFT